MFKSCLGTQPTRITTNFQLYNQIHSLHRQKSNCFISTPEIDNYSVSGRLNSHHFINAKETCRHRGAGFIGPGDEHEQTPCEPARMGLECSYPPLPFSPLKISGIFWGLLLLVLGSVNLSKRLVDIWSPSWMVITWIVVAPVRYNLVLIAEVSKFNTQNG